jgi:membrane carboxypeptidase/penicillin-binding protein
VHLYKDCMRYYPFVLGAQPVRPIDLASFYATIANEGLRATPYSIEAIERSGKAVYQRDNRASEVAGADRVSFYQLKTMMQGVLQRGTARSIAHLAPYVAGKTGTTDGENDAWFVGFTNDVTVAVWVGYDNADGRRRTLGSGRTGGNVAIPIFEPIIQAVWSHHSAKSILSPPSPEARLHLTPSRTEVGAGRAIPEMLRKDARGRVIDTQHRLVSRGDRDALATAKTAKRASPDDDARGSYNYFGSSTNGRSWLGWQDRRRDDIGARALEGLERLW